MRRNIIILCLSLVAYTHSATGSTTSNYAIDKEGTSKDCEFFISSFGDAVKNDRDRWLEGILEINTDLRRTQKGQIMKVGARAIYENGMNKVRKTKTFFGKYTGKGYLFKFPYQDQDAKQQNYAKIKVFNFFVDIRNKDDGSHSRLWMNRGGLTPESTFWGYPNRYVSRGTKSGITYTLPKSPILRLKESCQN